MREQPHNVGTKSAMSTSDDRSDMRPDDSRSSTGGAPGPTSTKVGGRPGRFDVDSVTVRFGGLTALDAVSLHVEPGEVLGVIGPNGAGKTTLFNVVCGFLTPDSGTLHWRGERVEGLRPHKLAGMGIARTLQGVGLFAGLTVLENVMAGATSSARARPCRCASGRTQRWPSSGPTSTPRATRRACRTRCRSGWRSRVENIEQNGAEFEGPWLAPLEYSEESHRGISGVGVIQIEGGQPVKKSEVFTTDDGEGELEEYTEEPFTPDDDGIPNS
jgi:ABC-type sugar transport system ATPase subunit